MQSLKEIKEAVDEGKPVFWIKSNAKVVKRDNEYYIVIDEKHWYCLDERTYIAKDFWMGF